MHLGLEATEKMLALVKYLQCAQYCSGTVTYHSFQTLKVYK